MNLPSKMTTAQLREHCEAAIARGQNILVNAPDLLALLVALDLRERLDPDVRACAECTKRYYDGDPELYDAACRVLLHEPKPDLSGAPS